MFIKKVAAGGGDSYDEHKPEESSNLWILNQHFRAEFRIV